MKTRLMQCIAITLGLAGCAETDPSFYSNVLRSDVFIQKGNDSKYDFLMVVDNSQSMAPIRQLMKDNMRTFVSTLNSRKAIDYQIAITTTDFFANAGDLVTVGSGASALTVVKSASSPDAIADFGRLIDGVVDSDTSFWEQGLESAYQALVKHGTEFSRPGVPLIIMVVSDEDDYSCQDHCYGPRPEINPDVVYFPIDRYKTYFGQYKAAENTDTFVFPITGLNLTDCPIASAGLKYMDVSSSVGGLGESLSICSDRMQASYSTVAQVIADRGMIFPLSSITNGDAISLWVNGQFIPRTDDNYTYDTVKNAIVFTGFIPRKGSTIEVTYAQKDK